MTTTRFVILAIFLFFPATRPVRDEDGNENENGAVNLIGQVSKDPCAKYDGDMAASCKRCGGDETGVFTCDRAAMPTVSPDSQYEVFYAESPLTGSDIAGAFGLYHSGITVVRKDGAAKERMTLQWYAIHGLFAAVIPEQGPTGPEWKNSAKVAFTNDIDDAYWQRQIHLTTVDGSVLNRYFDSVVEYSKTHPGYQLFSVQQASGEWGSVKLGELLVEDKICDLFTRDSVFSLQSLGASIIPDKIRVNTMRVYASEAAIVNIENMATQGAMGKFYKGLLELLSSVQATAKTFMGDSRSEKFAKVSDVAKRGFAAFQDGLVFIGSPSTGMYQVKVHAPYFSFGTLWVDTKTHEQTIEPEIF